MDNGDDRRASAVAWDEAREILVVVLLVAALLHLVGPMVRYTTLDHEYWQWSGLFQALTNVNALTGLLLLGSAVAVCTTPAADMVPRLRKWVFWAAAAVAVMGVVLTVNILTTSSYGTTAGTRLAAVIWVPAPATVLSGTAAWMARKVVLFG